MHGCVGNVKIFEMDLKSKVQAAHGALSLMYRYTGEQRGLLFHIHTLWLSNRQFRYQRNTV